ncbi:MAG: hypothetical protein UT13_C0001G0177 [Candidatus Pacebacteria bacterium GW2011_GWF2_38_9]|nr:MAG: ribose-5-phosphate isomerase B, ribose 5-phosphate isomerase B [candidate division TM6 bacterium GW2011_GWF2_28_16]KKQ09882.1 MAG: hypothetical protein US20_C0004G0021 [Candidatus Pacebacteria bacterium GW2011_GWF1_36_5]KKQ88530.1 MAG: hypothetical protein UT13_C0001G0177 [Candidatus Pacebacteria bacterium GW2011_GWF2_38_9]HAZ73335.1 ribose-5-phosphate isomerase [Candidatus Paceibacterota bacterium]
MKIYLGSDHGGFKLKEEFKNYLLNKHPEFELEDCGAFTYEAEDDYPKFAFEVALKTATNQELGVLLCRSGSGVVIAANKVKGIRAVELYDDRIAAHSKSHNQANVIAFSGDYLSLEKMIELFEIFLKTGVDKSERHQRRIAQITNYENTNN